MQDLYSWIGFIIFWGAVVIGLFAIILATVTVTGWHVLGHRIMTDEDYDLQHDRLTRLHETHRWFSAFRDLDLIWEYIFEGGSIDDTRKRFAAARGVTVYNQGMELASQDCGKSRLYVCTRVGGHEGPCAVVDVRVPQCSAWVHPTGSDVIYACTRREGHTGNHLDAHGGYGSFDKQLKWTTYEQALLQREPFLPKGPDGDPREVTEEANCMEDEGGLIA